MERKEYEILKNRSDFLDILHECFMLLFIVLSLLTIYMVKPEILEYKLIWAQKEILNILINMVFFLFLLVLLFRLSHKLAVEFFYYLKKKQNCADLPELKFFINDAFLKKQSKFASSDSKVGPLKIIDIDYDCEEAKMENGDIVSFTDLEKKYTMFEEKEVFKICGDNK